MTLLDAAKLGPSLSVFIQVTLEKQIEEMLESFEQSIKRFPEVMECYLMTGDSDYLLRVVVRDTVELQHFIIERLTKARGVANIRSSFALKQVKGGVKVTEARRYAGRPLSRERRSMPRERATQPRQQSVSPCRLAS